MSVVEIKMTSVHCNKVQHQGEAIRSLCLSPKCKANSAVCYKCLQSDHKGCLDSIKNIEDIPIKLKELRDLSLNVLNLQNQINQQFKDLLSGIELLLKPLTTYQEVPNLTNLNFIGTMLKSIPKDNILRSIEEAKTRIRSLLENKNSVQQIQQIEPIQQDSDEWCRRGFTLFNQQKYNEAIDCLNQAIQINPKDYGSWFLKGSALYQQKKYNEAIDCFNQAIQINPKDSNLWHMKGEALYQQKKYNEAIDCFNQAIQINPKDYESWDMKGNALLRQNRHEEAIQCYEQCLKINPNDSSVKIYLDDARLALKDRKQ